MIKKEHWKRYFTYAIGEILLVVIGIFIAIQLNQFYADRKNQKTIKNNAELLVKNLLEDSLYIVNWNALVHDDLARLSSQDNRLNSADVNLDTLIQIASIEYMPGVNTANFRNQSSFKTMISTGEINLFEKDMIETLYDYYTYQDRAKERSDYSFDHYLEAISNYKSKYFFRDEQMQNNPLHRQVWKNINEEDFITSFLNMFSSKRLVYGQIGASMDSVEVNLYRLLPRLRVITEK